MTLAKTLAAGLVTLVSLAACTVNTVPPVATTPAPVVVQTPAPAPAPSTVVVPRSY